jgi:hypothetical protein
VIEGFMKRFLVKPLMCLLFALPLKAQEGEWKGAIRVPGWSVDQDGEFVTITYGLSEAAANSFEVKLQLANVEQHVLTEPDAVTGHVGTVGPGPLRKIIWHYRKDYPAGLSGRRWKFILTIGWGRQKTTVATREGSFTPPRLLLEKIAFTEPNGNSALDAGEEGELSFVLRNTGLGDAVDARVRLALLQPLEGIQFDTLLTIGTMSPGATAPLRVALTGAADLRDGMARILVSARDRYDESTAGDTAEVRTLAFLPPAFEVVNRLLQSPLYSAFRRLADAPVVVRGDTSLIMLELKNRGRGKADSVTATVTIDGEGWNAHFLGRTRVLVLPDLPADSSEFISFPILADERAEIDSIRIHVAVSERHSAYGIADTIRLAARRRYLTFDAEFAGLMKRGLYDSAGTLCRRQIAIEPHRSDLYTDLGVVYESLGDRARAVEQYVVAAERGDRKAAAWLLLNASFKENTSVKYDAMPLPFLDSAVPVTIGVFPTPANADDPAGERLYNLLRANTDRKRVILIPYRAMISQLGVTSVLSTDSLALKRMAKDLGITYIIEAREADKQLQSFLLAVVRTADGQVIFSRKFQQSVTSTGMQDAGRLFKESLVPVYNTKRTYGPKGAWWK